MKDIQFKHKNYEKYIRYDNAGENNGLETLLRKERLRITFEYSARSTPQHGKIERLFAALHGRMRAMMLTEGMDVEQGTTIMGGSSSNINKID
jgi:hypothetical protein